MKKTEYFTSNGTFYSNELEKCIKSVSTARDKFLQTNKNIIVKIENESLQVLVTRNDYYQAIITLSYYEKE